MIIDAHQHFWHPARGDYDWMPKDNPVLYRPYAPGDLAPTLQRHGIDGTVLVQAAATVHETEYMLGLADACPWILGVVGWIDFEDPGQRATLQRLSTHPKFLGVRPMIQDIPDLNWMLRDDIQWAYQAIIDMDLTFDALGFPDHLPNVLTLMQRYPQMRCVYDHGMKPQIRLSQAGEDGFSAWASGMEHLARQTSGVCKLSGLVTEAEEGWHADDLRPFVDHLVAVFGPERLMWGSDWPVCRLRTEYDDWLAMAHSLTGGLGAEARAQIFGGTAARFYRLD